MHVLILDPTEAADAVSELSRFVTSLTGSLFFMQPCLSVYLSIYLSQLHCMRRVD